MTPTQRTLAECKRRGWECQVVERWNSFARRRVDLFDCIDVVACTPDGIVGIQTTSGSGHSARARKSLASKRLAAWVRAGGAFAIWSWSKRGPRNKRKQWTLRAQGFGRECWDGVL